MIISPCYRKDVIDAQIQLDFNGETVLVNPKEGI